MGENRDDGLVGTTASRQAELEDVWRSLPEPGTEPYWHRLEETDARQPLPLEVVARCLVERLTAAVAQDADRVFEVILRRIQRNVDYWAWRIASRAYEVEKGVLKEDLSQQCFLKLWEALTQRKAGFFLENFHHALLRLQQHVAHDAMTKAGEWHRTGVGKPRRVPRQQLDSLYAVPEGEEEVPLADQLADPDAEDAFDQADLSDLLDQVRTLPPDQREILLDRFWRGASQEETAAKLGITDRTVRNRLKSILHDLRARYVADEENDGV